MKSCFLLLAFSTALAAQSVEGDVVDGVTGAPIEGAYVSTSSANSAMLSTRTDAAGHFRFEEASLWGSLQVLRTGYRFTNWSLGRPASQPSSQGISGVRITLAPEAVISGKVLDEDGFPVDNAFIMVLHYQLGNGQRQLRQVVTRLGGGIHSDDLGRFRLPGLLPGRYIIQVAPNELRSWDNRYVPMFFPGGLQPADTELFEVKAGQQLSGIELRMTKYEGVTVTGRVVAPDGSPPPKSGPVSLTQSGITGFHYNGWSQKDGSFSIFHVCPGNYTLGAWPGSPQKAGDLMGQQPLQVGGSDVHGLLLTLHEIQPVDLTGTIVLEGGGNLSPMLIQARGASPGGVTARSEEDGSFVIKGLLPGHYFIQVRRDRKFVNGALDPESVKWAGNPVSAHRGAIMIDMSTNSPAAARSFSSKLEEKGIEFLDAPVSGGDKGAKEGTLTIMVGGKKEVLDRSLPVLQAIGKEIFYMGPPGSGQATKLCNQVAIALHTLATSESLLLGSAAGLELTNLLKVMTSGAASSWNLASLGPKIVARDFEPGFKAAHLLKDLRSIMRLAEEEDLMLPGAALVHELYLAVMAKKEGEKGTQVLARVLERLAEREIESTKMP